MSTKDDQKPLTGKMLGVEFAAQGMTMEQIGDRLEELMNAGLIKLPPEGSETLPDDEIH